jgi:hypothetical protein
LAVATRQLGAPTGQDPAVAGTGRLLLARHPLDALDVE